MAAFILFVQDQTISNRKEIDKLCNKLVTVDTFVRPMITGKEEKNWATESHRFPGISQEELMVFVVTAVFPLEEDTRKKERRAVMSVPNRRVMEGWDHSAESAPKRRKAITWWGLRAPGEARLPECESRNKESRHETDPYRLRQKDAFPAPTRMLSEAEDM